MFHIAANEGGDVDDDDDKFEFNFDDASICTPNSLIFLPTPFPLLQVLEL